MSCDHHIQVKKKKEAVLGNKQKEIRFHFGNKSGISNPEEQKDLNSASGARCKASIWEKFSSRCATKKAGLDMHVQTLCTIKTLLVTESYNFCLTGASSENRLTNVNKNASFL